MWFKLNLDGIKLYLRVNGYRKSTHNWCDEWCGLEFTVQSNDWLNYTQSGELLLACEVEEMVSVFEDLLEDRINETKALEFIEPDLKFLIYPKKDLREDPNYTYVKPGYEIVDVSVDLQISFWDGGLTANYLSLAMDREEISLLVMYLKLVMGQLSKDDISVQEMLKNGSLLQY